MIFILAGAFGFLAALAAHDLAAQALHEQELRPMTGTCPRCGTARGWTRPTCPECGRRPGREYFVALIGAGVGVAFGNAFGDGWSVVPYLLFLLLSLALAVTDLDALRIVDRLNIRGTLILAVVLASAAWADGNPAALGRAVAGAGAYFVGTNLMFVAVRGRGFGYGDVKLSVQLGLMTAYVSWGTLGWSVFITALVGGVVSVIVIAVGLLRRVRAGKDGSGEKGAVREMMTTELPYGPAMIAGSWIAIALAGMGAFPIPT